MSREHRRTAITALISELSEPPAVHLVAQSPAVIRRLRMLLPGETQILLHTLHDVMQGGITSAAPTVIVVRTRADIAKLNGLDVGFLPYLPIVLLCDTREQSVEMSRLAAALSAERVIDALAERDLWPAIERAHVRAILRSLGPVIRETASIPVTLRTAIAFACSSDQARIGVEQLAGVVRCDRCTLARQWKRIRTIESLRRIEDLLNWLLLVRARSRKSSRASWGDVARSCGATTVTLRRTAKQLAGVSLASLGAASALELCREFLATAIGPLLARELEFNATAATREALGPDHDADVECVTK